MTTMQPQIDAALKAIRALISPQHSLEECLDALETVREELVVCIEAIENDIKQAQAERP